MAWTNDKEFRDMKGGAGHKWIREHRQLILDYLDLFGEEDTLAKFKLKPDTLERIKLSDEPAHLRERLSMAEKASLKADISEAGVAQLRKEVRELKEQFIAFQDAVSSQVAHKFLLPLIKHLQVPEGLPNPEDKPNPLSLEGFPGVLAEADKVAANYDNDNKASDLLGQFAEAVKGQDWYNALRYYMEYDLKYCQ